MGYRLWAVVYGLSSQAFTCLVLTALNAHSFEQYLWAAATRFTLALAKGHRTKR